MASPVLRAAQKMAMSSGVVRRAASRSSSLIALATRYARAPLAPGSSSSFPPLLHQPFSTSSADNPDKSPEFPDSKSPLESSNKVSLADDGVSYPNLGDKIHNEIASYSNEVAPIPSRFPFDLQARPGSPLIFMEGKYDKEMIEVSAPLDNESPVNGDDPFLPMTVKLRKGTLHVTSYMTAKPDQLHVHKVILRKSDASMTDSGEYFKRVGITSKTISFLYDRLGYSRKNA